jgi:predicted HAD superfamily Cof-like phosphohydrolase
MSWTQMVREFHKTMGVPEGDQPGPLKFEKFAARHGMLKEEYEEYKTAKNIIDIVDAYGDMIYVIIGTMLIMGIDPDKVMAEIHKSNMTKKKENVASDGKILKDEDFIAPDLAGVLGIDTSGFNVIE